ncbi:Na/Pi cotransporter family protein [Patescibacteria group bacterium]|nr:Na/Pi cotransporter family protein [Patescibacteria group bacterium]MBU1015949.1 Na/Pi cotransporter family protein [Patescibacteria group bacterium]MBU1685297.1 Na/Pi cotransporter family protein [Patescibacteria group bacterium]MBU1939084.1 Na/Pi cotransporter family protein [Patescibacteria group bacterium]
MNWQILLAFLVGLIIFIHGIENFSREVLSFAGARFRRILRYATKNRFIAGLVGMVVTGLIQSSAATTVITIGLVSAGMISFAQSLGVIFGANVGTTITAQLVAFKVTAYAPFFIILGFFVGLLKRPYRYIGRGIFYFGLVFFGLGLVSDAITPIKTNPEVIQLFSNLSNPALALLLGLAFTALIQSSSITTGLVVVLAGSGILPLTQGILIMLGSNIGSTVTAMLASTRLSLHAKRSAAAHLLFNVIGVLLILPLLTPFTDLIEFIGGSEARQIANAHTIFNVAAAILFLAILTPVKKLVTWLVRGDEKEVLIGTKYLKDALPKSNRQAFGLIEKEVSYSLETVFDFYEIAIRSVTNPEKANINAVDKYEVLEDLLDYRIETALLELSRRPLSEKEAKRIVLLVRISNLVEQLGDTAKNLGRLPHSGSIAGHSMSPEALSGIQNIYERMNEPFSVLKKEFPAKITDYTKLMRHLGTVRPAIARGYTQHIKRLQKRQARGGSIFVEASALLEDGTDRLKEILKLCQHYARLR